MKKYDLIFAFSIILFFVDLISLFILSNSEIHLRGYGYLTLIALLPVSMLLTVHAIVLQEIENKKANCKHGGKMILGFTEYTKDPNILKTNLMCEKCMRTGYIETDKKNNTQRFIWDETKK